MDFITTLSNIEGICRSCYTLSYFTVPTIYLPIIAVLLVIYDELLRLILPTPIFLCKGTAARERQVPFHRSAPLMPYGLDDSFPQFPAGANWVFHQLLCHLLVLSLCFHSLLVARKIQIPTRKPIKASK
ncbi:hypothetical protein NXX23_02775 [Bacteroides ovatus]|nr:hypothetical protein [Bacteroides ovatus]